MRWKQLSISAAVRAILTSDMMLQGLPAFAVTQVGDVREVMAGAPCIQQCGVLDGHPAVFGMGVAALPLVVAERLEEHDPAGVKAFDKLERPLGRSSGVMQVCPGCFVVQLDGGPV